MADQTYNDFKQSIQLQDSLIRRLEIIGEAIKNLPNTLGVEAGEGDPPRNRAEQSRFCGVP